MSNRRVEPERTADNAGWIDRGPRNYERDLQNPDLLVPPITDHGTVSNLRFSFSDAHMRIEEGGWTREVTNRELPASHDLAGVDMCLKPGAYRELHWHKEAEWAFMIAGNARVTALDAEGRSFIDDINAGDLWNFEAGIPHSIQALDQGCEFLLVFSEPDFSENNTFLLTDWLAHTPKDIVAANFKVDESVLANLPGKEKYIFNGEVPGPISEVKKNNPNGDVPSPFTFHMNDLKPHEFEAGDVGVIPIVAGHYIKNIGDEPLIFLEVFKNPVYSDISLNKWLATSPTQMISDHLNISPETVEQFPKEEAAVVWYDQSHSKKNVESSTEETPQDLQYKAGQVFK